MMNEKRTNLVVSVDYEIFGNGTGDVRQHVIEPAAQMAKACQKYGVPLTVFFEVEEYLAFERYQSELEKDLGYNPAAEIRAQIIEMAGNGHDIQLHIHPEWHDARYENGEWILNRDMRSVDDLFATVQETIDYIASRKAAIENLILEGGLERSVTAYRAGAFWAQPATKLLAALAANNIPIDSSVVYGQFRTIEGCLLDFRKAPRDRRCWQVRDDVIREDSSGSVWEFPIYSRQRRRFQQITWKRLKAKFSPSVPVNRQKEMVEHLGISSPFDLFRFLFEVFPTKFDFHNQSPKSLVQWALSASEPKEGEVDVLVSIGHTKEHMDDASFEEFIAKASASPDLKIVGFGEVARLVCGSSPSSPNEENAEEALLS